MTTKVVLYLHAANAHMYLVSKDGIVGTEHWLPKEWFGMTLLEKGKQVSPPHALYSHGMREQTPDQKPGAYEFNVDADLAKRSGMAVA